MKDLLTGLKHIGVMLVLFLLIYLIGTTENKVAIVLTTTAVGAGASFILAALNDKKVAPKLVFAWGGIGLLAGIIFAASV